MDSVKSRLEKTLQTLGGSPVTSDFTFSGIEKRYEQLYKTLLKDDLAFVQLNPEDLLSKPDFRFLREFMQKSTSDDVNKIRALCAELPEEGCTVKHFGTELYFKRYLAAADFRNLRETVQDFAYVTGKGVVRGRDIIIPVKPCSSGQTTQYIKLSSACDECALFAIPCTHVTERFVPRNTFLRHELTSVAKTMASDRSTLGFGTESLPSPASGHNQHYHYQKNPLPNSNYVRDSAKLQTVQSNSQIQSPHFSLGNSPGSEIWSCANVDVTNDSVSWHDANNGIVHGVNGNSVTGNAPQSAVNHNGLSLPAGANNQMPGRQEQCNFALAGIQSTERIPTPRMLKSMPSTTVIVDQFIDDLRPLSEPDVPRMAQSHWQHVFEIKHAALMKVRSACTATNAELQRATDMLSVANRDLERFQNFLLTEMAVTRQQISHWEDQTQM